jgi:DNA-nicking Smr family endonuclease
MRVKMVKKLLGQDKSLWDQIRSEIEPLNKTKSFIKREIYEKNSNDEKIESNINQSSNIKNVERKFNISRNDSDNNNLSLNRIKKVAEDGASFSGIHRKLDQRMTRGNITIDDTLDLHGMTQEKARENLTSFLISSKKQSYKIVLVITGKGLSVKKEDEGLFKPEKGVLNKSLPIWLKQEPLKTIVNGFRYANQRHGGRGAYYILLKSKL